MITQAEAFIRESSADLLGESSAWFSADRAYRYRLTRSWGISGALATWIMLNPSTADATGDDPTIRRCTAFTRSWGLGGLIVVNLFALRATDPRELRRHPDPAGPDADRFVAEALRPSGVTVAAWGAHPVASRRAAEVMAIAAAKGAAVRCLGVTRDGHPRHPLYVRSDAGLVPYPAGAS